ncbi:hypothetical protein Lal_00046395 [Lupinus albus]|nr:hypothetical protein Lal_00046395 [Lupinus albus]
MEYLYRVIQELKSDHNFNFHPKCEKLGIINLCFADDLLLFGRGDKIFEELLMDKFKEFSDSTSLLASNIRCKVYFGGSGHTTAGKHQACYRF